MAQPAAAGTIGETGTGRPIKETGDGTGQVADGTGDPDTGGDDAPVVPVWEGVDRVVSEEIRIIGPDGEKVDVMTFQGSFERDLAVFAEADSDFKQAVDNEDDDSVETMMNERFYHKPEMFYSPDKLVISYGVPAPTPAFVYNALGKKPLPTKEQVVVDTADSIAARFNLRYNDQKWLMATLTFIADDSAALKRFIDGDLRIFDSTQFRPLGGLQALAAFEQREAVFEALRQSSVVRQSLSAS